MPTERQQYAQHFGRVKRKPIEVKHSAETARRMAEMLKHQADVATIEGASKFAVDLRERAARWEQIAIEAESREGGSVTRPDA